MTDFIVHATKCLSNWGGYELQINHSGDAVRYRMNYGDRTGNVSKWLKIYYTNPGRAYFKIDGRREYLDEYMRV